MAINFVNNPKVGDNVKIEIGDSSDLQIYHNGSNSYIQDTGSGVLAIDTNGSDVRITKTDTEFMAKFITDGAVELYHNNSKKFETTSTGATLSGDLLLEESSTPTLTLKDTTNNLVARFRAANSYTYITVDHADTVASSRLVFQVDNATSLYLDHQSNAVFENGNVGIGETSIDARLHITKASAGLVNQKFESAGSAAWRLGIPASQTYFAFDNANDNLSAPKLVINNSGFVGIGSTNPIAPLEVKSSEQNHLTLYRTTNTTEGIAGNINFDGNDSDSNQQTYAKISSFTDDPTAGSIAGKLSFSIAKGGDGMTSAMTIQKDAQVSLNQYGSGSYTGTAAYTLQVDSAGNIIEGSTTGGGTVTGSGAATRVAFWSGTTALSSDANLYWDNGNDRLGVGTSSPNSKLTVGGNGVTTLNPTAIITDTTNGGSLVLRGQSPILAFDKTSTGVPKILMDGGGLQFKTGTLDSEGDVDMIISSDGNVGIGLTAPGGKLSVSGIGTSVAPTLSLTNTSSLNFNHSINAFAPNLTSGESNILVFGRAGSTKNSAYIGYRYSGTAGSNDNLLILGHWASDNLMTISGDGKVGIGTGTTSPSNKLHVNQDNDYAAKFGGTGGGSDFSIEIGQFGTNSSPGFNAVAGSMVFKIADSEAMRINTSRNVGIDNSSPTAKLQVGPGTSNSVRSTVASLGAATNGVLSALSLVNTSGNNVAGYGTSIDFHLAENYSPTGQVATVAENTTVLSALTFSTYSTALNERMRIKSTGKIRFNAYGQEDFTGTTAYLLAVEADGDVIEVGPSDLPGGPYLPLSGGTLTGALNINNTLPTIKFTDTDNSAYARIRASNGGLLFEADETNTQADSNIRFEIDASEKMRIDSAGSVGIGTTSPTAKLMVVDNSNILSFSEHGSSAVAELKIIGAQAHDTAIYFGDSVDNVRAGFYYDVSSNQLQVRGYNNSTKIAVTSAGRVGIGTTNPGGTLDVDAASTTANSLTFGAAAGQIFTNENSEFAFGLLNASPYPLYIQGRTSSNTARNITLQGLGGNIGIGTYSPTVTLQAGDASSGTDNAIRAHHSDGAYTEIRGYGLITSRSTAYIRPAADKNATLAVGNDANTWNLISLNSSTVTFNTDASEHMRITSAGKVGIATTSPAEKLDVAGNIHLSTNQAYISFNTSASSGHPKIKMESDGDFSFLNTAGSSSMIIENGGNVGIGTTSADTKLDVVGGILRNSTRISSDDNRKYPLGHYNSSNNIFDIDPTWSQDELRAFFNNTGVSWVADADAPGGYAIEITGGVYVGGAFTSGFPYIPIDSSGSYYMECYIKNVTAGNGHYMGGIDFNASFGSLGGNPGSYGYWVMSNTNPGTSWTKVSGTISGFGNSTGQFKASTKYMTPMSLFNYTGSAAVGSRVTRISGWRMIRTDSPGSGFLPLSGGTLTGGLTGTTATFSSSVTAEGAFMVPYAAGQKKPMIVLRGATSYGLFHTEATSDIFSFDYGGVSKHSFYQSGDYTLTGGVTFGDSHFIGDDSNDNLLIQSSANENIIIDSADDIILDADGADIIFKDGGTEFGRLSKGGGSDLIIGSSIADKDIFFTGIDGTTAINALTLDMSNGGNAIFAGSINMSDNKPINYGGQTMFTHTGSTTKIGDNTSASTLSITGGRLGIGATSPGAKLEVVGDSRIYDSLNVGYRTASTSTTNYEPRLILSGKNNYSDGTTWYGNYGQLLLTCDANMTSSARRFLITNALDNNKFAIVRSASATSNPVVNSTASGVNNGTADFVIDNTGQVGIGTDSPSGKLDISGDLWVNGENADSARYLKVNRGGTSDGGILLYGNESLDWQLVNNASTRDLLFYSYAASSTVVRIEASTGNVGINNTSPDYKLDVSGGAIAIRGHAPGNSLRFDSTDGTTSTSRNALYVDTNNVFQIGNANYDNNNIIGDSVVSGSLRAGNDGYDSTPGGTAFSHTLAANSGTSRVVNFDGTGYNPSVWWTNDNSRIGAIDGETDGLAFWTNNSSGAWNKNFYIKPTSAIFNQDVGIGTTSPSAKLHVAGASEVLRLESTSATGSPFISFFQTTTRRSYIYQNDTGNNLEIVSEYGGIKFFTGTNGTETEKMVIQADGDVGIGVTNPVNKLQVGGKIYSSGDIQANSELRGATLRLPNGGTSTASEFSEMQGFIDINVNGTVYVIPYYEKQ